MIKSNFIWHKLETFSRSFQISITNLDSFKKKVVFLYQSLWNSVHEQMIVIHDDFQAREHVVISVLRLSHENKIKQKLKI